MGGGAEGTNAGGGAGECGRAADKAARRAKPDPP